MWRIPGFGVFSALLHATQLSPLISRYSSTFCNQKGFKMFRHVAMCSLVKDVFFFLPLTHTHMQVRAFEVTGKALSEQ